MNIYELHMNMIQWSCFTDSPLQARSARTAEPAFLPLGEDIPGQNGRDMPREDPLKDLKANKVRSTK